MFYTKPAKVHSYKPDFILPNGIIVEVKGYLDPEGRKKYGILKTVKPDLDIRFLFDNPKQPIRKGSKVTIADWADNNGFPWAKKVIPADWFGEPKNSKSIRALYRGKDKENA